MVRRFSITIGSMLVLAVALGALLLSLVVPEFERPQDDSPSSVPDVADSPGDQDERAMEPPSTTAAEPGTSPGRRANERARPAGRGPTSQARTDTRTPAASAPPAERRPPRPTPTPSTVPAPQTPARQLRFLPTAEPLVCDASERTAGTLRGATPGEAIRLTSPFLDRPIVLSADSAGTATVTWTCDPGAARTVAVTAWGADGRRGITFPVTGVSEQGAPSGAAIEAQSRVDDAADIVLDAVESVPDTAADRGFAGVVVSPDRGEVDLYWKGGPPQAVTDAIEEATTVTGIRVVARPATLTRHHLLDRAHALVSDDRTLMPRAAALADRIHRVAVPPEGSGLEVGIAHPAGLDADGVARWSREAQRTLEGSLGVPVHLVVEEPPTQFDRVDDSSPWHGGARIVGDGQCSSGFAVRRLEPGPSTPFGLLTAAHCRGDRQGQFRNGDRTQVVGPDDGGGDLRIDSRLIPVDEAGARIYTGGGGGGAAEFTRPVRRSGRNVKGDEVCTSGVATGARCDLVIVNVDTFYRPAGSSSYSHVVEAVSRPRRGSLAGLAFDGPARGSWITITPDPLRSGPGTAVAAGRGDSGEPVFTLTNDGGLEARGTIAGGSRAVDCGRHHLGACTATVFFVDLERVRWTTTTPSW